jgi:hypothetical protein
VLAAGKDRGRAWNSTSSGFLSKGGLIDANAPEDEIFFGRIPRRPCVVEVEEIHTGRGKKRNAAERVFTRRTAKAALSTAIRY